MVFFRYEGSCKGNNEDVQHGGAHTALPMAAASPSASKSETRFVARDLSCYGVQVWHFIVYELKTVK